ncbi:MAG: hypothetical protein FWE67_15595, partial [Planctomycetaceae bacterium]|nr:hypothetical protein [Planctomycetaceae bacterium]
EFVFWTAHNALKKSQRPVILNKPAGKYVNFSLRAVPLVELIEDIATQIDVQVDIGKYPLVAVSEFTTGDDNSFGREYGVLTKHIADALRRELASKKRSNKRDYDILNENMTQELFRSHNLTPSDIGTRKTANLKVDGHEIPLLITGRIRFEGETGISCRVFLHDAQKQTEERQIGGIARLNGNEIAMTGASGKFGISSSDSTTAGSVPKPQPVSQPSVPAPSYHRDSAVGLMSESERRESEQIVQERKQPHPLSASDFSWKTTIAVRPTGGNQPYQPRALVFSGNDCYLPVSVNEEYQIRVSNTSKELVFARILVDGLNTLGERRKIQAKGAYVEAGEEISGEYELAPRVSLDNARPWVLEPGNLYHYSGFVKAEAAIGPSRLFKIVDADQSEAARQGYTDQIGLITIGIFRPKKEEKTGKSQSRGIGTKLGEEKEEKVTLYDGNLVPGEMIVAFNIRYLTPEMLQKTINWTPPGEKSFKPVPASRGFGRR